MATTNKREEFYIGYMPAAPAGLARFARKFALLLIPLVGVAAALAASGQGRFDAGLYEFGVSREFEGVLYEEPAPMLRVAKPGRDGSAPAVANFLLAGFGKQGPPEAIHGNSGKKVSFRGSLVYRRGLAMIEMNEPDTFKVVGDPEPWERRGAVESLGEATLKGEIVDTKCFLGVMRPASGKVHRACAIRCIEGGVPAGFWAHDADGSDIVFVLAGASEDEAPKFDIELVGLPCEAKGAIEVRDDVAVLRLKSVRRLAPSGE